MERRFLVVKSSSSSSSSTSSLPLPFVEQINEQLAGIVKRCGQESTTKAPLACPRTLLCQLPGTTDSWQTELQVSPSCLPPSSLAPALHSSLDSLPPPGTHLTSLLWLCPALPEELDAALYGALQRAVTWHRAGLLVVNEGVSDHAPAWMEELGAEVTSLAALCSCHGLADHLSPALVWRGGLAFYHQDPDSGPALLSLPGCELRGGGDSLSSLLASLALPPTDPVPSLLAPSPLHYSPHLEVLTPLPLSSLPPHLLSPHSFLLVTPPLGQEPHPREYLAPALVPPDSALLVRLQYSTDRPKEDLALMKTGNWRKVVIDSTWQPDPPCQELGAQVSSHHLLLYRDPLQRAPCTRGCGAPYTAVLLQPLSSLQPLARQALTSVLAGGREDRLEAARELLLEEGLDRITVGQGDWIVPQVRRWVRGVQAAVLEQLRPQDPKEVEDILMAVQEKLLADITTDLDISCKRIDQGDFQEIQERLRSQEAVAGSNPDEWQERRFLRFLEAHSKVHEKKDTALLLAPSDQEYVVLEAKELLKFFDSNGGAVRALEEVTAKNSNCPLRPQKTDGEYQKFMVDNFDKMATKEARQEGQDFQFSGFKFKGSNLEQTNFSQVEFTQYHDVYYNTGDSAERYDLECKERKDQLLGRVRETACTFSVMAEPQRLKVERRSSEQQQKENRPQVAARRQSPRKKSQPGRGVLAACQQGGRASGPPSQQGGRASGPPSSSGEPKRRSGGELGAGAADLSDVNRKKLRSSVYECLLRKGIQEKSPIFRPCFTKLFSICKMYVIEQQNDDPKVCTKKWMLDICLVHGDSVVGMEKMMNKRKK